DRYRPRSLSEVVGQPPVRMLRALAENPSERAILLESCKGGVGKTSTAIAFAYDMGCDVEEGPLGGFYLQPCSELGVDRARELFEHSLALRPMFGNGWKVVVLEELDWLSPQVQRYLKVRLEHLPRQVIVIATSNGAGGLDAALLQRFRLYAYSSGPCFAEAAWERLAQVWKAETGNPELPAVARHWGYRGDDFSLRVALDEMEDYLTL